MFKAKAALEVKLDVSVEGDVCPALPRMDICGLRQRFPRSKGSLGLACTAQVAKTCLGNRNDSKRRLKAAEAETSFQCLIPLITYVVQKMPIMTMPTHPESETMEKRQKMMVLRTIKEDKNPEKAFKIYERYQYAKSTEVQKLKPNTDEEANPAEEEDEEVWEDGDSGHRRLGEAQLQRWKQSPTICPRLIQAALGKGEAPEHLQYINDIIVSGNTATEGFEKGEKIIHILLEAGFAIKKSKVKGPAQEIQFLKGKWQDGQRQIPTKVINKTTATSPQTSKKETQAFLGAIGFWRRHIPEYKQIVSPLYLVTRKKNDFHWGPEQQQAFAQIKQEVARVVAFDPVRIRPEAKNVLYSTAGNNGLS
ncbi:hypothetical protein DUI87_15404 [Hirundo rustica rustica]|uniref:Reverse transcriptase/retrotransposon-derived protein RNase H-like domain-containing protein n=1 Tax=Hirundo rustica rustica TaxID=333673 RepID=A0A3M0K403_HIRRU|nr:hypothetical protein DUI87_15404 [Hirundo rustica rustica]